MPYDERTINELQESADMTPVGIQLEVNTDIFNTVHNLIRQKGNIDPEDEKRLYHLWRKTIKSMAKIEIRKSHGLSMEKQISMLQEAFQIEIKYLPDQLFHQRPLKISKDIQTAEEKIESAEWMSLFEKTIWPGLTYGKTGNHEHPMAYIVVGQPGSGKTRMSASWIEEHDGNIIQSMSDNFRGYHPHAEQLAERYGTQCTFFTLEQGRFLSDLAIKKAVEGRYHILQEGSLLDVNHTKDLICFLKENGYTVYVIFRASPKKESWKAIHQIFLQQRLKAPGLSRLITKEYHDKACTSFLSATKELISQNLMDRLIIKSSKGLLYDSDDMPTERAIDILTKRMTKE